MRALAGYLLLLTALSFGAFEFYMSPEDREAVHRWVIQEIDRHPRKTYAERSKPAGSPVNGQMSSQLRSFSPSSPVFLELVQEYKDPAVPALESQGLSSAGRGGWSTIVNADHVLSSDAAGTRQGGLILDLQRELKRVRCYRGALNGRWTPATRSAMAKFARRVNASLPPAVPGEAELALVRGHSGAVCAVRCRVGESVSREGHCVASTILARQPDTRAPRLTSGSREAAGIPAVASAPEAFPVAVQHAGRPLQAPEPLPGRMAVGGPPPPPEAPPQPARLLEAPLGAISPQHRKRRAEYKIRRKPRFSARAPSWRYVPPSRGFSFFGE